MFWRLLRYYLNPGQCSQCLQYDGGISKHLAHDISGHGHNAIQVIENGRCCERCLKGGNGQNGELG